MTWISLVCLLALSSSVFGRSVSYGGGYGSSLPRVAPQPIVEMNSGYGQETFEPKVIQGAYGSSLVSGQVSRVLPSFTEVRSLELESQPQTLPAPLPVLTQADILCRGQRPETVIPINNNRGFIVCLDDGKGVEQECPKGLFYHEGSRRCERKLGPSENFCSSQPCFNGGQCIPTDSWFQCQCPHGFDGPTCELDARVCHTQQPCGSAPDTICQSFRIGAALEYVCIFQDGLFYGLNAQQTHSSPCGDFNGPHSLAVSDKGFIMCNGEKMHVEACPGGTIWDSLNRACSWPDMLVEVSGRSLIEKSGSSYGETRTFTKPTYGGYGAEKTFVTPRVIDSYGSEKVLIAPKLAPSYGGYGAEKTFVRPRVIDSYGGERTFIAPKAAPSYGGYGSEKVFVQPKLAPSYGGERTLIQSRVVDSYGGEKTLIRPRVMDSYGGERTLITPKVVSSYGGERTLITPRVVDSYGGERTIITPRVVDSYGGEKTLITSKVVDSYGGEKTLIQPKAMDSYGGEHLLN